MDAKAAKKNAKVAKKEYGFSRPLRLDFFHPLPFGLGLLQSLGIVTELTGQKTNRVYSYQPYVELLMR